MKMIVGRGGAANAGLLLMDILASILAYLGCVTGIVGALALSFFLFFAAPDQSTMPIHTAAIAAKTATVAEVAPASKNEPAIKNEQAITSDVAKTDVAKSDIANAETAPPTPVVVSSRQKRQQLAAHLRRLAQEERARRWAYQQDPDFEARFLGYAD